MEWTRERSSFRDPSGFVFTHESVLYRQVNQAYGDQYKQLIDSGLYAELAGDDLIVTHDEVELRLPNLPPAAAVLRPAQIPFISYPYEWCFGQLRAAALLTLEIQRRAVERRMVLRDASAYNVQFVNGRATFIDTLSFGPYVEGSPWIAYRQFCQHFLGPLALIALVDPSLGQLSRVHLDGVPVDITARLLPLSSYARLGLLTHIQLHRRSLISGTAQHGGLSVQPHSRRMGKTAMLGLIESLTRTVDQLSWTPPATLWSTYSDHTNYTAAGQKHKRAIVANWLQVVASDTNVIWDLGANTGAFSQIAAQRARTVVSFDLDHAAVERHFLDCQARNETKILPLIQDLANPSPAIGWHHGERASLAQRGPADTALALALVHHLAITGNVPFDAIAVFLRAICRHLIIEFVPKEDSQVRRMLALREDVFPGYSQAGFESAFQPHFEVLSTIPVAETARTLYLMKRR